MFDFRPVFLPVFDPCTIQPFNFFFLLQKFHFLGFSKQSVFLPFFLFVCHSPYINTTCMCPGRFFGEPTYYGHPDDTDTKAFPFLKRKMFLNSYFFPTFVIVKRKLTPDHNIVKFSTRFTRLGLVLRWIHNTLTMLRCSFIINKRTDDKETSVNVMN